MTDERDPRFQEGDGAVALDLGVLVPHELADDEQRFVTGFPEHVLLGLAEELLPAFGFGEGEPAEVDVARGEFVGGVLPTATPRPEFGGEKQGVVQECGSGGDHGGTLMAIVGSAD